jgi:hypothetical protein
MLFTAQGSRHVDFGSKRDIARAVLDHVLVLRSDASAR